MSIEVNGEEGAPSIVSEAPAAADALLSVKHVTAMLGVCRRTLERWIVAGDFPRPLYLSRLPRWRRSTFEAWVSAREATTYRAG
jgi:predicted DNA-binding transcriptional regulator AlpA